MPVILVFRPSRFYILKLTQKTAPLPLLSIDWKVAGEELVLGAPSLGRSHQQC